MLRLLTLKIRILHRNALQNSVKHLHYNIFHNFAITKNRASVIFICKARERYSRARRYHKPAFASERAKKSSTEPIIQNQDVLFGASEDPCKGSTLAASYKMQHFVSAPEHIKQSE